MESALKLLTEKGFHGTSTAQISKEAGIATVSFSITFLQRNTS
jgi:AcrR family transcriptional regulator